MSDDKDKAVALLAAGVVATIGGVGMIWIWRHDPSWVGSMIKLAGAIIAAGGLTAAVIAVPGVLK